MSSDPPSTVTSPAATEAAPGDVLRGRHVRLVPLQPDHAADLVAAATQDRATYGWTLVPETVDAMRTYIDDLLAQAGRGTVIPFAQQRLTDGRLVGCTRFLDIRRWSGRPHPDEVEIGGTWLSADAQRTAINTEAKLLLLTHAFEVFEVCRVALMTDARNQRSRDAIQRIGATFEGVLRNHRWSYVAGEHGLPRDSAVFSITPDEWPRVKEALIERLGGGA